MSNWVLRSSALAHARHGFFTRLGGVSTGPYASLNCSTRSGDDPAALQENRARVAAEIGVEPDRLLGLTQVHGPEVVQVRAPWNVGEGPKADAMVTDQPGFALGIITADCAPVLFADDEGTVVGAAHAGWRGAAAGVLEAVIDAMITTGVRSSANISAVVGPCIGASVYEVGGDMRASVLEHDSKAEKLFCVAPREGHFYFDLPGYCIQRLKLAGVERALALGVDTLGDEERFFSHRRRTLAGGGVIGHQISVISPAIR